MKFFIDTANLDQIKEAQSLGILDGVTTNPSLMAKEGIKGKSNIAKHYIDMAIDRDYPEKPKEEKKEKPNSWGITK